MYRLRDFILPAFLALAYLGGVLTPYRVLPLPSQFANALAATCVGLGLIMWFAREPLRGPHGASWTWLLLLGVVVLQPALHPIDYPDALVFPAGALLLCVLLSQALQHASSLATRCFEVCLAGGFVVASLCTLLLQWLQFTFPTAALPWFVMYLPDGMQPFGNLAQRNQAAFVHALGIAALLSVKTTRPMGLGLQMLGASLMVTGVALSGSRLGAIMALLAFMVWGNTLQVRGIVADQTGWRSGKLLRATGWALAYVAIYAISLWMIEHGPSRMRFDTVVDRLVNVSNLSRVALQQQAWQMFLEHFWVGAGWGSFSAEGLRRVQLSWMPLFADHSHFFVTQIAAELGLVGLLALVPAMHAGVLACRRERGRQRSFVWLTLALMIMYSCSEYPLWHGYFLFVFVGFLSIATSTPAKTNVAMAGTNRYRYFALLAAVLVVAGTTQTAVRYLELHWLGQKVFTGKEIDGEVKREVAAKTNSPGFSAVTEMYTFVIVDIGTDDLERKLELGARVVSRFVDARLLEKQALLLLLHHDNDKAFATYQAACRFYHGECDGLIEHLNQIAAVHGPQFREMYDRLKLWRETVLNGEVRQLCVPGIIGRRFCWP